MRARAMMTFCLAGWLTLLWMGCSSEQHRAECPPIASRDRLMEAREACVRDADCRSGLCDRETCGFLRGSENYGMECEPLPPYQPEPPRPPPPPGVFSGPHQGSIGLFCGAYLCLEGRCRSCQSDAECQYWHGSGVCIAYGNYPGKQCRADSRPPPRFTDDPPAEPPPTMLRPPP